MFSTLYIFKGSIFYGYLRLPENVLLKIKMIEAPETNRTVDGQNPAPVDR